MRYLRLHVGDSALVDLDANQIGAGVSRSTTGPLRASCERTLARWRRRLAYTGRSGRRGPQVVIRYYEAHPMDGDKVPICAVARLSDDQMRKLPESKPGTAILDGSVAAAYVVDAFR